MTNYILTKEQAINRIIENLLEGGYLHAYEVARFRKGLMNKGIITLLAEMVQSHNLKEGNDVEFC